MSRERITGHYSNDVEKIVENMPSREEIITTHTKIEDEIMSKGKYKRIYPTSTTTAQYSKFIEKASQEFTSAQSHFMTSSALNKQVSLSNVSNNINSNHLHSRITHDRSKSASEVEGRGRARSNSSSSTRGGTGDKQQNRGSTKLPLIRVKSSNKIPPKSASEQSSRWLEKRKSAQNRPSFKLATKTLNFPSVFDHALFPEDETEHNPLLDEEEAKVLELLAESNNLRKKFQILTNANKHWSPGTRKVQVWSSSSSMKKKPSGGAAVVQHHSELRNTKDPNSFSSSISSLKSESGEEPKYIVASLEDLNEEDYHTDYDAPHSTKYGHQHYREKQSALDQKIRKKTVQKRQSVLVSHGSISILCKEGTIDPLTPTTIEYTVSRRKLLSSTSQLLTSLLIWKLRIHDEMLLHMLLLTQLPQGKFYLRLDNKSKKKAAKIQLELKVFKKKSSDEANLDTPSLITTTHSTSGKSITSTPSQNNINDVYIHHILESDVSEIFAFTTAHANNSMFLSINSIHVFSAPKFFLQLFQDLELEKIAEDQFQVVSHDNKAIHLDEITPSAQEDLPPLDGEERVNTSNGDKNDTNFEKASPDVKTPDQSIDCTKDRSATDSVDQNSPTLMTGTSQSSANTADNSQNVTTTSAQEQTCNAQESKSATPVRKTFHIKNLKSSGGKEISHYIRRAVGKTQSIDIDNFHIDISSEISIGSDEEEDNFEDCN
ncbi:hypothetical protein C9374_002586 [Naegleria lovaniensis]|uniref:Uncharacterized protein n=1 Tax=Naegleria lovaniensis TaxID=51637 RepID=A0AA88KJY1_NAELO|nr:uncharacterized protein C9374_002586 [Naegleria lovaniensis]KAG2386140.1 hypothetical protein C9374_002586 [Naegleria lovaniensis]